MFETRGHFGTAGLGISALGGVYESSLADDSIVRVHLGGIGMISKKSDRWNANI